MHGQLMRQLPASQGLRPPYLNWQLRWTGPGGSPAAACCTAVSTADSRVRAGSASMGAGRSACQRV